MPCGPCYPPSGLWTNYECMRPSGVARGGSCPRAPPGGRRQNPAKEFIKMYIWGIVLNSERVR